MSHEDLRREEEIEGSSDRSFGFVFAIVFLVIAAWPLLRSGEIRFWALVPAAAFAIVAWLRPALLAQLNRQWMKLGILLGKVVSPIALGVLFFLVVTPMALLMRMLGKDVLSLARVPAASTYWVTREPPGPAPQSMDHQF